MSFSLLWTSILTCCSITSSSYLLLLLLVLYIATATTIATQIDSCPQFCHDYLERQQHSATDFLSTSSKPSDLLLQLELAKEKLFDDLKTDYGEFFETMWVDNLPREDFAGAGPLSVQRFRRKLKMKLYEMQEAVRVENERKEGCNNCDNEEHEFLESPNKTTYPKTYYSKFVWATGGQSTGVCCCWWWDYGDSHSYP